MRQSQVLEGAFRKQAGRAGVEGGFHGLSHWLVRAWHGHFQGEHEGRQGKLAGSVTGVLAPQARTGER